MSRQVTPIAIYSVLTFFVITFLSLSSSAAPSNSLNESMVKIGYTMEELFPILFTSEEPDAAEQKKLKDSVDKLNGLFDTVKPHIDAKSPTYKISFEVIKTQLAHAQSANKYKNFNYTKSILRDITTICTSCHTQDSKIRTLFPDVKREVFQSDFQYAEFNYMTRNYDRATKYYKKFLKEASDINEADLLSIMKQLVTINIQIYYRPDDAISLLEGLKGFKHHTKFTRKTLDEWLIGISELKKDKDSLKTIKTIDQLNLQVHKILGDLHEPGSAQFPNKRERIARLWLRGALYHYLNTKPSREEIPIILYWLAIVDRSVNFSIYYSLADMYLKECILNYTSHPYAHKCYEEYKENIILSYSGSRGTDIPEDIQNELDALKIRVEGAPK